MTPFEKPREKTTFEMRYHRRKIRSSIRVMSYRRRWMFTLYHVVAVVWGAAVVGGEFSSMEGYLWEVWKMFCSVEGYL